MALEEPVPNGVNIIEELIAEDGFKLTQTEDVPLTERIIASAVMLGKGRNSSEWKEISQTEADEILKAQDEYRQEQERQREIDIEEEIKAQMAPEHDSQAVDK